MARTVQLGKKFDEAYTTGSDIFTNDLAPQNPPARVRITCAFDSAGVLSVRLDEGGSDQALDLNSGATLEAGKLYAFDVDVAAGQDLNFRYSVNAQIQHLIVAQE